MADEISMLMKLNVTKSALKHTFDPAQVRFTMTGSTFYDAVHDIGTTEESVTTFADVGTEGVCVIYNLDTTNYVQVGFSTGVYGMRLKGACFPATFYCEPGVTLYLKANTAACKVRIIVYEA